MIRDDLATLVANAAVAAQQAGEIPAVTLPEVLVERPQRPENGDYATSLPLRLKKAVGGPGAPIELARAIARHIEPNEIVREVVSAPPGFINLFIREAWLQRQVDPITQAGEHFGDSEIGRGKRVQIEFVSANPVGPVHVGNGRGAVTGSTLASLLESAGYSVEREYYLNDAGTQALTFGRTLYARYQQLCGIEAPIPEDGYPGEYMIELAATIRDEFGERFSVPAGQPVPAELREIGIERMIASIRADLESIGVRYDRWFSERSLFGQDGTYEKVMAILRRHSNVVEKEGALWFTAKDLGQDRENVLVRTGGAPTYFATDIAYHYDKFVVRGFDEVIDVWGADHHGHIARLQTAVQALGVDSERLTILLYQLVTLRRGEEVIRIGKRSGNLVELREIVQEVGADASRFFFLMRSPDSTMDFDLELAKKQSNENPVFYVQYAHARIAGILRTAAERGIDYTNGDVALLTHVNELQLIRRMLVLPELLDIAVRKLEVHHLPHYAQELAAEFHAFYTECQVVSDDEPLTRARLKLVMAARTVLARVLHLMGMTAPDRM